MRRLGAIVVVAVLAAFVGGDWASAAIKPEPEKPRQPSSDSPPTKRPPIQPFPRVPPSKPPQVKPPPVQPPQTQPPGNRPPQAKSSAERPPSNKPSPAQPPVSKPQADQDHDRRHDVGRRYPYVGGRGWHYDDDYGCQPFYYPDSVPYYVPVEPCPDEGNVPASDGGWIDSPEPKRAASRSTNARANDLAWKFIGYGDAQFAQKKFAEANANYRKAASSAPQVADAWCRQGFALAATGRYSLAAGAFKRGLTVDPKWPKSAFRIGDLFGDNHVAKATLLDTMAKAAIDKPTDSDRLFALGIYLYFDGQADRAEKLFEQIRRIAGNNAEYVQAFSREE